MPIINKSKDEIHLKKVVIPLTEADMFSIGNDPVNLQILTGDLGIYIAVAAFQDFRDASINWGNDFMINNNEAVPIWGSLLTIYGQSQMGTFITYLAAVPVVGGLTQYSPSTGLFLWCLTPFAGNNTGRLVPLTLWYTFTPV